MRVCWFHSSLSAACTHTSLLLSPSHCMFVFFSKSRSFFLPSLSLCSSLHRISTLTSFLLCFLLLFDSDRIPHTHFPQSLLFFWASLRSPKSLSEMVDLSGKGSEAEDTNARNPNGASSEESPTMSEQKKTCADCGTSKTPLWRGGPAGPKSLCNACGIRSRKKKRAILGLNKGSNEEKKGKRNSSNNNIGSSKFGDSLKQRLMALGREVLMQRSTVERQRKKLGEEEQAAVLLMALSYGSVYA